MHLRGLEWCLDIYESIYEDLEDWVGVIGGDGLNPVLRVMIPCCLGLLDNVVGGETCKKDLESEIPT